MNLDRVAARRDETYTLLALETDTLALFQYSDPLRLGHVVSDGVSETEQSAVPADGPGPDSTATAFGLYMMLGIDRERKTPSAPLGPFLQSLKIRELQSQLEEEVVKSYTVFRKSGRGFLRPKDARDAKFSPSETTSSATLPNSYNTAIHVAGVLVADRYESSDILRKKDSELLAILVSLALRCARQLNDASARGISAFDSYDRSKTDLAEAIPNVPYLWYWNYVAVLECLKLFERAGDWTNALEEVVDVRDEMTTAVAEFRDYVTSFVAYLTASHHAGVDGQFDASDFLFAIAIAALRAPDEHHGGSEKIVQHALSVFFSRNIASEGSIVPRSPAFVDLEQRPITISTAEHAALLLEALAPYCDDHIDKLDEVARYVIGRRLGGRGWGSDRSRVLPSRNVFVVVSSLSFLLRYAELLDRHAENLALSELQVPIRTIRESESIVLTPELEDLFQRQICWPIEQGRRDLATMSLVLKGPPGTAKTTSAKRIAALLGWPLIVLDQGAFLRQGYANVEAEAERVFQLLGHAKDKVLLFDEFEEMVADRVSKDGEKSSRFLTTAMLPRLQRIRDQGDVVFVIATNHLEALDPAAYRFGRIDRVVDVNYPSGPTRRKMLSKLAGELGLSVESTDLLTSTGFPYSWADAEASQVPEDVSKILERLQTTELNRFGYGEIRQVVRLLLLRELQGQAVTLEQIEGIVHQVGQHARAEEQVKDS